MDIVGQQVIGCGFGKKCYLPAVSLTQYNESGIPLRIIKSEPSHKFSGNHSIIPESGGTGK
jgi:hypothetical protein